MMTAQKSWHRGEHQQSTRPAFDKRDFIGANDMVRQGLGEEQLHEPAGVEQGRTVPPVKYLHHDKKGRVVEDRTDRPDKQNAAFSL